MTILLYLILNVLNYGLTLSVQLWDRRRLGPAQRARVWNYASWGAALYGAFFLGGCFSMIPWCWVTRQEWAVWRREKGLLGAVWRSALILLAGVAAVAAILAVLMVAGELLGWALGIPEDPPG